MNKSEALDEEDMYGEGFLNTTRALIYGRNDYPPKAREIIKQYGNKTIQSLTIMRHPVQQAIVELLNMFSLGAWKKNMAKQPYDKLFHLALIIQFDDGTVILAEKNEVINLTNTVNVDKQAETRKVSNLRPGITLNTMLNNAQKILGPKYFTYSAYDNNCQYFVMTLLKGIGAGNDQDFNFIKQNTEQLFEANPSLIGLSDKVTNTGAFFNVLTQGGTVTNINNKNISNNINTMAQTKILKKLKELDDLIEKTDISNNTSIPDAFIKLGDTVKKSITRRKSMKGKGNGDLVHIDIGSHNASSKGKNSMSGGGPVQSWPGIAKVGLGVGLFLVMCIGCVYQGDAMERRLMRLADRFGDAGILLNQVIERTYLRLTGHTVGTPISPYDLLDIEHPEIMLENIANVVGENNIPEVVGILMGSSSESDEESSSDEESDSDVESLHSSMFQVSPETSRSSSSRRSSSGRQSRSSSSISEYPSSFEISSDSEENYHTREPTRTNVSATGVKKRKSAKGGALEHVAGVPHTGLFSHDKVPSFSEVKDTKKIVSENALLNQLTGKDLESLKLLSGKSDLHTPSANAKTTRENAKRIAAEIKLLKGKEKLKPKRAARFAKGSPEALEWGRKMREARSKK